MMKNTLTIWTSVLVLAIGLAACNSSSTEQAQNTETANSDSLLLEAEKGIREANDRLYAGLNDMFKGDLEILNKLWSQSEKVTQMGPFGGRLTGWQAVQEEFQRTAALNLGGSIVCAELHVFAGLEMGYTVCVEEGENVDAQGNPVKVSHRATNIFRYENGEWKLVHHHTDISSQLIEGYED
jgi:ketosteroid isomerase-like protein